MSDGANVVTAFIDSNVSGGAEGCGHGGVVDFERVEPSGERRQWTLKGISPDAIEQSREAAKRSGMKLNSWVTAALQQAADIKSENAAGGDANLAHRIDEMERYIREEFERLKQQQTDIANAMTSINAFLVKMYAQSQ